MTVSGKAGKYEVAVQVLGSEAVPELSGVSYSATGVTSVDGGYIYTWNVILTTNDTGAARTYTVYIIFNNQTLADTIKITQEAYVQEEVDLSGATELILPGSDLDAIFVGTYGFKESGSYQYLSAGTAYDLAGGKFVLTPSTAKLSWNNNSTKYLNIPKSSAFNISSSVTLVRVEFLCSTSTYTESYLGEDFDIETITLDGTTYSAHVWNGSASSIDVTSSTSYAAKADAIRIYYVGSEAEGSGSDSGSDSDGSDSDDSDSEDSASGDSSASADSLPTVDGGSY